MNTADHIAFYLLDIVKRNPIHIGDILAPYFTDLHNRPQINVDPGTLIDVLYTLCIDGYVGQITNDLCIPMQDVLPLTDVPMHQLRAWSESQQLSPLYGLTSHGGAMWEAYAHPYWEKYVQPDGDRTHLTITGANKDRVARFMSLYDRTWERVVDPIWTDIHTWKPFYWKMLTGHWYQVVASAGSMSALVDTTYDHREKELFDFLWGWYTHPTLG